MYWVLFNDARSIAGDTNDFEPYRILESVKDGMATTSDNIKFKIPNTVMVFSNHNPDFRRLSTDRWKVYVITEKGLKAVTATDLSKKKTDSSSNQDS